MELPMAWALLGGQGAGLCPQPSIPSLATFPAL